MRKISSLQRAETIISIIDEILPEELSNKIYVKCFDNCREQGYVISIYDSEMNIAISEYRTSDDTVVYVYPHKDKVFPSNLPNESSPCWNNKKLFKYNELYECAEYIIDLIKGWVE